MGSGRSGLYKNTKGARGLNGQSTQLNMGKQSKHLPQSNNYQPGKSIISISNNQCQQLINKYSGTGTKIGINKECVDFGTVIGYYVDYSSGKSYPTTMGIIHYSKSGAHIVPAKPKTF